MKATHRIMFQRNKDGVWSFYDAWSEKDARDTANRLWTEGFYRIQLFVASHRGGFVLLKDVKQNERVAKAKQKAHLESLAAAVGAEITFQ